MNDSKTAILIDSGCDISMELVKKYDIKMLSLKVMYGDDVFDDGVDIDPLEVYRKFPDEVPKTSTPNMQDVLDVVESIRAEGYPEHIIPSG